MKRKVAAAVANELDRSANRRAEAVRRRPKRVFHQDAIRFRLQLLRGVLAAAIPIFVGFAYYGKANAVLLLCSVLLAVCAFVAPRFRPRSLDWAIALVGAYELLSVALSQYRTNSLWAARTVCAAILIYFLMRAATQTINELLLVAAAAGCGGVALAGFALTQFNRHFRELQTSGLSDAVAFRYRLIAPPPPWVLGEWFTLLFLTLPLMCAVAVFFGQTERRKLAAVWIFPGLSIAAALGLSCSRAVLWGVGVFIVVLFSIMAFYHVVRVRTALTCMACVLCTVAALVIAENAFYPGVLGAYAGRHISQVRSSEGRIAIWKRSAAVFAIAPWWGVGAGNAPLFLTSSADEDQTTGFASRTFSLPIQMLTEKGVVGVSLYLAVLMLAGWEAHRKLRNPKISPEVKGMICCFVAGMVAVVFRELAYSSLFEHGSTAMLFAISLAPVAAEPLVGRQCASDTDAGFIERVTRSSYATGEETPWNA
jgi:hypothetical protein